MSDVNVNHQEVHEVDIVNVPGVVKELRDMASLHSEGAGKEVQGYGHRTKCSST